jgi:cytochrome c oxidase subunit 3
LMIFHMKTLSLLLSFLLLSLEFQSVTFCVMLMCSEIAISIIIGIYFTNLQEYEYIETSFTVADSVYKSTFFVATGFHGLHMIIGLPFLITCVLWHLIFHFSSNHHFGFEAAAWYWHFVNMVWLFLYVSIYWWGR